MLNVIITGSNSTLDNGEAAILVGSMDAISRFIPDVSYVVGSAHQEIDKKRYSLMLPSTKLKIVTGTRARTRFSIRAILLLFRYIPEYAHADIGVDISGDGFGDYGPYGMFGSFTHAYQLLLGIFLRKPVVVFAQSIGPFKTRLTKAIARFVLNRVSLITVREEITKSYLEEIGVRTPPVYLTADAAFLLNPSPPERIDEILAQEGLAGSSDPLVGVSISELIHQWAFRFSETNKERYCQYLNVMAGLIDHVVEKMGAIAFLYCQTTGALARHDDRKAARLIYERVRHKNRVKLLSGDYTASELKGVVGRCQMFIGSKLHSTIASTSMLVPTVSIAYSHKVHGIIGKLLWQEKVIVDIRKLSYDEFFQRLLEKTDYVWSNRSRIRKELEERRNIARERALRNAELVATLVKARLS